MVESRWVHMMLKGEYAWQVALSVISQRHGARRRPDQMAAWLAVQLSLQSSSDRSAAQLAAQTML
jgi:hypothetical protein